MASVKIWIFFGILLFSALTTGCAVPKSRGAEEVRYEDTGKATKITQAELQEDIQRFVSTFIDRLAQNLDELRNAKSLAVREAGLKRALLYGTSALEIASESSPELALLDMLVFISLSRSVLDEYWIPFVLGDDGNTLERTLGRSENEIWTIASKIMNPSEQDSVKKLITQWQDENRGQIRVEGIRLGDFSKRAGKIAKDRDEHTRGLFKTVAAGVEIADAALLTVERVLFIVQRLPFLWRIHANLATAEIISTAASKLASETPFDQALKDTQSIAALAGRAAQEGRLFAESLYPIALPVVDEIPQDLHSANTLAQTVFHILNRLTDVTPTTIRQINAQANAVMDRFFLSIFFLGLSLIGMWWGGYFLVKRRLGKHRL